MIGKKALPDSASTHSSLMDSKIKKKIEKEFGYYINSGQVEYLKAGHLDVLETDRRGVFFTDPCTGRRFADGFTSAGCFNVGRHNPIVLKAMAEAIDEVDMGSAGLISRSKIDLARKLTSLAPGDLNRVFFTAGGGDAVDGAIKLARGATGRSYIISTVKAYHGHTGFALSANGKEHYRKYFEPLIPGFSFAPFNDLEAMEKMVNDETAAILIEPIQGEAGIFPAEDDYLRGLRELCDRSGAILIFDEIQTGMGRTGKMFACEHSGVTPDIMTAAKSMGGGLYPSAAVLYRDTKCLIEFMENNPRFHVSWGGTDIGCRVSLAVLDYLVEYKVCENAEAMGEKLRKALEKLKSDNPGIIREIRGRGLMIGIEYIHEFMGPMMADNLAKNGVFAAYSGNAPQVMRFMFPLVITESEMDEVILSISRAVEDMKALLPLALAAAKIPQVLKLLNNEKVQTLLFGWVRKLEDISGNRSGKGKRE